MIAFTDNPETRVIRNLPFPEYVKLSALNQSLAKTHDAEYDGSPALFRYHCDHPDQKDTIALGLGRAFHTRLLEPKAFESTYRAMTPADCETIFQQWKVEGAAEKSKGQYMRYPTYAAAMEAGCMGFTRSKAYRAWVAKDKREIISAKDSGSLSAMTIALWDNDEVSGELQGATLEDCEMTLLFPFKLKDGRIFQLKVRLDICPEGDAILDAKTCQSTNARKFAYAAVRYGYDFQAAFYLIGANACGLNKKRFGFVAQEKTPPFLNCIHWMPEDWIKHAKLRVRRVLSDIAESIRLDRWPNPPTGMLEPPEFLQNEIDLIS